MRNTLDQAGNKVNDRPIEMVYRQNEEIEFVCKVLVGGRVRTQRSHNLIAHMNFCNRWGWEILSVTMNRPDPLYLYSLVHSNQGCHQGTFNTR